MSDLFLCNNLIRNRPVWFHLSNCVLSSIHHSLSDLAYVISTEKNANQRANPFLRIPKYPYNHHNLRALCNWCNLMITIYTMCSTLYTWMLALSRECVRLLLCSITQFYIICAIWSFAKLQAFFQRDKNGKREWKSQWNTYEDWKGKKDESSTCALCIWRKSWTQAHNFKNPNTCSW